MKYYSVVKNNDILKFSGKWVGIGKKNPRHRKTNMVYPHSGVGSRQKAKYKAHNPREDRKQGDS